jgi:RND family efflux transporter MFP subunit
MNTEPEISSAPNTTPVSPAPTKAKRRGAGLLLLALAVLAVLAYAIISGLNSRASSLKNLGAETKDLAEPTVVVVRPKQMAASEEVVLPGDMQAYVDTPIYARSNGYLTKWYVDIGEPVKAGRLLAEIETPEVDRQLRQARADWETAKANYSLAVSTAKRWQTLLTSDSVSKQETDEKIGDLAAKKAIMTAAEENVHRLEEVQSFQKVYAPFNGIITARKVDVGALIDAGANSPNRELFHEGATDKLRVFINVPEVYTPALKPGTRAEITLAEYPGRSFGGTLVRTARAIDLTSRTLLAEVDVQNTTGELLPGAYASVHFKLPAVVQSLTLPGNTLLFRAEGLQVAAVRNGRTQLLPIKMGRDFGNEVEIISGIHQDEAVIVNPSDSIESGEPVRIKTP